MTTAANKQTNTLSTLNQHFATLAAEDRVAYALDNLPGAHILSSSFGAQAAVMLHLLTQQKPDIPVILIDTGYLFPETYRFVDELVMRLDLNLKVYRSTIAPAWQEARHGELWKQGVKGIDKYNEINKVEPMRTALQDLNAGTWFAGLRRNQATSREAIDFVAQQQQRYKVHPIADWTDRDIGRYLKQHDLPYHPLWKHGYVSIGDIHTTRKLQQGMAQEDTRFFGLKRECGLHTEV